MPCAAATRTQRGALEPRGSLVQPCKITIFAQVDYRILRNSSPWADMGVGGMGGYIPRQGPPYLRPKLVGGVWQFFPRSKKLFGEKSATFFFLLAAGEIFFLGGVYTPPSRGSDTFEPSQLGRSRMSICMTFKFQTSKTVEKYPKDGIHLKLQPSS